MAALDRNNKVLTCYSTLFQPPEGTAVDRPRDHALSLVCVPLRVMEGRGPRMCHVQMDLPTNFLTKQGTSVGRSLAKRWLAHPVCDVPTIQTRSARVEHYVLRPDEGARVAHSLRALPVQRKGASGRCLQMLEVALA